MGGFSSLWPWKACPRGTCAQALTTIVSSTLASAGCGKWADKLACGEQECGFTKTEWTRIQGLANVGATPARPDTSNVHLPVVDAIGTLKANAVCDPVVQLGWRLYYETLLSGSVSDKDMTGSYAPTTRPTTNGQVSLSCKSCHDPQHAGSDITSVPRHVSIGAGWYDVNAQQTLNAARQPVLYWNGRTDSLWAQAAQVMESPVSMNGHRMKTFWVIVLRYRASFHLAELDTGFDSAIDALAQLLGPPPDLGTTDTETFESQYNDLPPLPGSTISSQEIVTRVHVGAAKAIAAYEWLLSSDGSAFDRFVNEGPDSSALSPAAVRGLRLFIGRASCVDCHNSPLLSDGKFHNVGIPQVGDHVPTTQTCGAGSSCDCSDGGLGPTCLPAGAHAGHQKLVDPAPNNLFYRGGPYDDVAPLTHVSDPSPPPAAFLGAWRTPSLRDVALTAPYMHDGSLATLADVVWHYDQADSSGTLGASELSPLLLTAQDRDDLVAFLESLTGEPGPKEIVGDPAKAGGDLDGGLSCAPQDGGGVIGP